MLRTVGILVLFSGSLAAPPTAQTLRSAILAPQLTEALNQQKLDAIAAQDPDEPDRFVAALLFQDTQLLLVSARYALPPLIQAKLGQKQYRDVYLDLQGAAIPDTSVFFQDMKADGLCSNRDQTADIVYEGAAPPTVFDGDSKKHNLSETEYEAQVAAADRKYSRNLEILLAQLRGM
jgi:hypothetical protein